jgi:hypothetical protein
MDGDISDMLRNLKVAATNPIHDYQKKFPSPLWEGMKGRGDQTCFVHPHPAPPPSKGEGTDWEISNIFV